MCGHGLQRRFCGKCQMEEKVVTESHKRNNIFARRRLVSRLEMLENLTFLRLCLTCKSFMHLCATVPLSYRQRDRQTYMRAHITYSYTACTRPASGVVCCLCDCVRAWLFYVFFCMCATLSQNMLEKKRSKNAKKAKSSWVERSELYSVSGWLSHSTSLWGESAPACSLYEC